MDETDVQTIETVADPENTQMEMLAKLAAQVLSRHYPAHLWAVGWMPGMALVIKNMATDVRYGYSIDVTSVASISQFEHEVMIGGGEILERMGAKRGQWNGEFIGTLEK